MFPSFLLSVLALTTQAPTDLTSTSLKKHVRAQILDLSSDTSLSTLLPTERPIRITTQRLWHCRRMIAPPSSHISTLVRRVCMSGKLEPTTFVAKRSIPHCFSRMEVAGLFAHNDGSALLMNESLLGAAIDAPAGNTPVHLYCVDIPMVNSRGRHSSVF